MPSRANPNTPTSLKPKTASTLKKKRQQTQRLAKNKITKPTPLTSLAIRKAAPLSRKKAKKIEKMLGHQRRRVMEGAGEVEMKDVQERKDGEKDSGGNGDGMGMELDEAL